MTSRHLGNVNVFVIIVIVPPNVAAVDRVPRQAVAFRLVLGRKEDRREAAAIGEAKEEAPVVVRSKIERILVNLTQTFEPFCFVPIDASMLVSPFEISFACHSVRPPSSRNVPVVMNAS